MSEAVALTEIWRGDRVESLHLGHVVICGPGGEIVKARGNPETVIYPRSSAKMIQALPLVESGAADAAGLGDRELALAFASHNGAAIHARRVTDWLGRLGQDEDALRCGARSAGAGNTAGFERLHPFAQGSVADLFSPGCGPEQVSPFRRIPGSLQDWAMIFCLSVAMAKCASSGRAVRRFL